MNCATPTDFNFSFQGFCKRGGETDVHADGWGLVFYQAQGIHQFHDVEAASTSPLANYFGQQSIQTNNMMGHIRYATQGQVNLANQHPFSREMWGIRWCFCHNGEVPIFCTPADDEDTDDDTDDNIRDKKRPRLPQLTSLCSNHPHEYYHPVGTTDSEATFCAILNALRCKFTKLPSLPVLHQALQELCTEIAMHDPEGTILNFLLTCGPHTQWVYSWPGSRPGSKVWNGLHYIVRGCPFSKVQLCDMDHNVDFSTLTSEDDCVSVIATKPLTDDEEWTEIQRGQLLVFDQGKPWHTPYELFQLELLGHGLHSTVLQKSSLSKDMKQYNLKPTQFQGECTNHSAYSYI
jgi:predicted glutamine amidotransferase